MNSKKIIKIPDRRVYAVSPADRVILLIGLVRERRVIISQAQVLLLPR